MNKIKYTRALSFGFSQFFNNFKYFFKISLRYFLWSLVATILLGIGILPLLALKNYNLANIIFMMSWFIIYTLIEFILWELMSYEILNYGFKQTQETSLPLAAIFNNKQVKDYVLARLSYYVRFAAGIFLFIIPGLYIFAKYLFTGFAIVKNNNSIEEDKKINIEISKNRLINFFFWGITVNFLISILSILTWFVAPPFILANVHAYKQVTEDNQE